MIKLWSGRRQGFFNAFNQRLFRMEFMLFDGLRGDATNGCL